MTQRSFDTFMDNVDAELRAITGHEVTSNLDIEDYDYAGCFEDGLTPRETARAALEEAGF